MMMDFQSLISFIGFEIVLLGFIIGAYRNISRAIKDGDDNLHERINRVKEDYVKREDLDGHIQRLETSVRDIKSDLKEHGRETNRRLDAILSAISNGKPTPK